MKWRSLENRANDAPVRFCPWAPRAGDEAEVGLLAAEDGGEQIELDSLGDLTSAGITTLDDFDEDLEA